MSESLFDRAARTFADQWMDSESTVFGALHATAHETRLTGLQAGAKYFRIIRNFPKRFDVDVGARRLAPAYEALESFRRRKLDAESVPDAVSELADAFGSRYGGRRLVSAASKCLWLLHRSPVVISDSQAKRALRVTTGDYADYVRSWRAAYVENEAQVTRAVTQLRAARPDVPANEVWFRERVFDLYLWFRGKPGGVSGI